MTADLTIEQLQYLAIVREWESTACKLELENRNLRKALKYIANHEWLTDHSTGDNTKWINELTDIACKALSSEYPHE